MTKQMNYEEQKEKHGSASAMKNNIGGLGHSSIRTSKENIT